MDDAVFLAPASADGQPFPVEEAPPDALRPAARMRAVAEAAAGVIGADSHEALRLVLEAACRRVLPCDVFYLLAYDPPTHSFRPCGSTGLPLPPGPLPADGTLEGRVVKDRRSLLTCCPDDLTVWGRPLVETEHPLPSAIRTPVLSGDEVLGLLSAQSYAPDRYTPADVEMVEVIASLAATGLANLRLAEEREATEEAMREQQRQLREAQHLALIGSWSWVVGSDRVAWSEEMFRVYGLPFDPAGITFDAFLAHIHPDDQTTLLGVVDRARREGRPYECYHRVVRPDGAVRIVQARGEAEIGPDGAVRRLYGTGQDVTERKEAEEALRASEESYRTIFELASDAIFVHDVETGTIYDANQKACELHGFTLEEFRQLGIAGISDGAPPYDVAHAQQYIRAAMAGEPQLFEWKVRNKRGERLWVEVSLHRVPILGEDRILASVRNITERKQAGAALQRAHAELEQRVAERTAALEQAEQRFRAIVEASPTPLLLSRIEDGAVLYANDRLEALLGAPPGTLVGRQTPDFYFDLADRPRVLEMIRQQGYVRDLELRIKRLDGTPRWTSLSAQRLVFNGQPAIATSLVDISERKQTEEALRESEESYRGLFDSLTELVYVQGFDGRFLNVNEAVVRTYGYTCDELIGQTPALLADPARVDVEATMERVKKAVAGEPQRFDWWGRRKDGSFFPKEVVLTRSTYFGQDVIIAVARDVTDRVQAEEALRKREEHFRRLIEDGSDIIAVVGLDGRMRYASPSTERLLGYALEERLGRNSDEFLHPDDAAALQSLYAEIQAHPEESRRFEFRFRHKDGTWRILEGILRPLIEGGAVTGFVVNARDVTERVAAERTLRYQKTLLEAQGEASIDGILVVSEAREILSYNHRFVEMFGLSPEVVASKSDEAALQAVLDALQDPEAFLARVEDLYEQPDAEARDEVALRDGRVFDRYSAPVVSSRGERYGRIWFFRDITAERLYAQGLRRELEIGRQIQQGFLPAQLPTPPGWEIAARFHPASQVAGDFYDAFELAEGRVGLVIADVCGKGLGAALFMALFRSLLRAYAERASTASNAASDEAILLEAVRATNDYITRLHRPAHTFASVFFGLLDPQTGALPYVNAGHEPPVVIGPDGPGARLAPTGPALGLLPKAPFQVAYAALAPGDLLLAFTDGVTEARDAEREFFTEERLFALLTAPAPTATALLGRIEKAVHTYAGDAPPFDDLTLLAIRRDVA